MAAIDEQSLLDLFAQVMPAERWQELEGEKSRAQIYTLRVVVGMMLVQRLNERGTQQEAVHQVTVGSLGRLLGAGKRVREGKISSATGAYARACGRVSINRMEKVCDLVLRELGQHITPEPSLDRAVLLIDGTSISLEHSPGLLAGFPPGNNQYGEGHWGILKMVAVHEVQTGIAQRPAWGAMYGPSAVSEQELATRALEQAPARSVIIGDGNFGIFYYAYAVVESKREALFRLTKQRAEALGAGKLRPQGETKLCWCPSRYDRMKHPDLPPNAQIEGRLIVVTRKGFREALYLFTTLTDAVEKVVALYGQRWNLELDLRTLKRTLRLYHLRGKSREAVEKELLIAVVGYGLVRAFMALAARRAGLPPRRLSFTRCYGLLNAMVGKLCSTVPEQRKQAFDRVLAYMGKSKLPNRPHRRAYTRAVWGFKQAFPKRCCPSTGPASVAPEEKSK
jgi:hypothetical protein